MKLLALSFAYVSPGFCGTKKTANAAWMITPGALHTDIAQDCGQLQDSASYVNEHNV